MATSQQIADVRANTDEYDQEPFTNTVIESLIDGSGVNSASAIVWRRKAARYAKLVDVSEAGASHAFSDLYDNAIKMAEHYERAAAASDEDGAVGVGRTRVHVIERP